MATILSIIPYHHLAPPMNGGQLRCFHLLIEMAKTHDLHAIVLQSSEELKKYLPNNISIYSPVQYPPQKSVFDILPTQLSKALHYRWLRKSIKGPANDILLKTHHLIKDILINQKIDIVYFEHISAMLTAPFIKRLNSKALKILDAHNVDHRLIGFENKLQEKEIYEKAFKRTKWYESNLDKFIDAYFTCSEDDKNILKSLNAIELKAFVIPNGVDIEDRMFDQRANKKYCKRLIYCGALNTVANKDGLLWFYNKVWPDLMAKNKEITLTVIGVGSDEEEYNSMKIDRNINFVGNLIDVVPHYYHCGISIVPLRIGSGTRLKILEAMSLGNPVVSTKIGAEGIPITNNNNIVIANTALEFKEAILSLINNGYKFDDIRFNANKFVTNNYDWKLIGNRMNSVLNALIENRN